MFLGNNSIGTFKLGVDQVDKVYLGNDEVWSSGPSPINIVDSTDPFGDGSLLHKFQMEDSTATVGVDASNTSVTFSPGEFANAGNINGSARFGVASTTLSGNIFSYSIFIKSSVSSKEGKYICDFSSGRNIMSTGSAASNNFAVYTGSQWVDCGFEPTLNVWTHIVLTNDGGIFKVYENKILVYTSSVSMSSFGAGQWGIGGNNSSNVSNFSGMLDQFEIYNRVLTQTEIDQLYVQEI